jgi:hypothetical protein
MVNAKQSDSGIPFVIATFLNEGANKCRSLYWDALKLKKLKIGGRDVQRALSLSLVENLEEKDREELHAVVDVWLDAKGEWGRFSLAMLQRFGPGAMNPYTKLKADRMANGTIVVHAAEGVTSAQELMLELLNDAESWRLAGKCKNCGRYMVLKTRRSTWYCSKSCNNARNIVATKAEVKKRKTHHIIAASALYKPGKESWRDFVLEKADKAWRRDRRYDGSLITKTFLTQRTGDKDPQYKVKEPTN